MNTPSSPVIRNVLTIGSALHTIDERAVEPAEPPVRSDQDAQAATSR